MFATDDIDVFVGEQGAEASRSLRTRARQGHPLAAVARSLRGRRARDQPPHRRRPSAAARRCSASRSDKRKNDDKDRALQVLRGHHGHEIHYWGPWSFEDVASGRARARSVRSPPNAAGRERTRAVDSRRPSRLARAQPDRAEAARRIVLRDDAGGTRGDVVPARSARASTSVQNHSPSGFNIGINEGSAAGQSVPHMHVHLIPRFPGDTDAPKGGVRWVIPEQGRLLVAPLG